jgi:GntR family transcriptional regulator
MPTAAAARLLDQHVNLARHSYRCRLLGMGHGHLCLRHWYYLNSTMPMRQINRDDSVALYDVVAGELRRAIAEGEAGPGERMPRAVDLAAILGVNKNTVIRALHILRDEGLLDFTRGRGVRVVGTPQKSALMTRIDELLEFARSQGYMREEVATMISSQESG